MVEEDHILKEFKKAIICNDGDEATETILLYLCGEILDCSVDAVLEKMELL